MMHRQAIDVKVVVIEDSACLHVPAGFQNIIDVQKTDFLTYEPKEFFDVVYSPIAGSISDVFKMKLLCVSFWTCLEHCLIITHSLVFEVEESTSVNADKKWIIPKTVRKLVRPLMEKSRVKYLSTSHNNCWKTPHPAFGFSVCKVSVLFYLSLLCA